MYPASIPSDPLTLLAALFTLFGLPLIIFSLVLFYAGYIRHDADQALAELEAELDEQDAEPASADEAGDGQPPHDDEPTPALESESAHSPVNNGEESRDAGEQTQPNGESKGQ